VRSRGAEHSEGSNGRREGMVSWTGKVLAVATWHTRMCQRTLVRGYARAPAGLCRGLNDALSAASVRPAGQAARGFVVELLDRASRVEQRRVAVEQRPAAMGCHGAPQLTRRLNAAGAHVGILVARGGDGWTARRWEFGQRRPTVSQQRKGTSLSGNGRGSGSGA
jgi:hypothetical protein